RSCFSGCNLLAEAVCKEEVPLDWERLPWNDCARHVFDAMPFRSTVSWNAMIAGTLCACAEKYATIECKQLHTIAIKLALDSNSFVGTAVLDGLCKMVFMKMHCVYSKVHKGKEYN
ncbi:hypothetical protein BAE44_0010862, partial [Dichanthelium oligosanthes]